MDVKQAVTAAKLYVAEVFSEETITAPTLEEVEFDESGDAWNVTVGFFRPAQNPDMPNIGHALAAIGRLYGEKKEFKIVRISNGDGKPLAIKNRDYH